MGMGVLAGMPAGDDGPRWRKSACGGSAQRGAAGRGSERRRNDAGAMATSLETHLGAVIVLATKCTEAVALAKES